MDGEEHVLVPFEPEVPPHTNGSKTRRRIRAFPAITFGVLLGALVATSAIPRLQWLNLARIGWWGRPVLAALLAGLLTGALRRSTVRAAATSGAVAGLVSLWGVYVIVRMSIPVLFVERSFARSVAGDLARLAIYAVPSGAVGAAAAWRARDLAAARRTK